MMNERIRECLPNPFAVDYQQSSPLDLYTEKEMMKFARRIIDECAKQCEQEPGLKYSPNTASAMDGCKERILALKD